jgi:hypothetical protein
MLVVHWYNYISVYLQPHVKFYLYISFIFDGIFVRWLLESCAKKYDMSSYVASWKYANVKEHLWVGAIMNYEMRSHGRKAIKDEAVGEDVRIKLATSNTWRHFLGREPQVTFSNKVLLVSTQFILCLIEVFKFNGSEVHNSLLC